MGRRSRLVCATERVSKEMLVANELSFSTYFLSQYPHILPALKQRILAFLYREAIATKNPARIQHFHLVAGLFIDLVMWRSQFIDEKTMLFKFGMEENVVGKVCWRTSGRRAKKVAKDEGVLNLHYIFSLPFLALQNDPPLGQLAFFVIYNIESTSVLGVYESASDDFLHLYETNHAFRGTAHVEAPVHSVPGVATNLWFREREIRFMHAVWKAKNGGWV